MIESVWVENSGSVLNQGGSKAILIDKNVLEIWFAVRLRDWNKPQLLTRFFLTLSPTLSI